MHLGNGQGQRVEGELDDLDGREEYLKVRGVHINCRLRYLRDQLLVMIQVLETRRVVLLFR
jgi:hypothetical protein